MRSRLYLIISFTLFLSRPGVSQTLVNRALADQYFLEGDYEKAAVFYEKVTGDSVYTPYLTCLLSLKDYEKAEKLVKKQVKKKPGNLIYGIDLGYVYTSSSRPDKAEEQYRKILDQLKPDQQQIIAVAAAFYSRNNITYSIETYLRGQRLMGSRYRFRFELADLYFSNHETGKAIEQYFAALEEDDHNLQGVENALQDRLYDDPEKKNSEAFREILLRRIQRSPDHVVYTELMLWFLIQEKDFETALVHAKALDKRLNEDGGRIISLAVLSVSNENYEAAINAYRYILERGVRSPYSLTARMGLLNTVNRKLTSSGSIDEAGLRALEHDYKEALDDLEKSSATFPLMRGLAHLQAFYLNKITEGQQLLEEAVQLPDLRPSLQAECKLELGDILLLQGDVWEATLLYSQVDKAFKEDPLGQEGKLRNAKLSYYMGDFEWAQAQLDVLKSATSQLIANDALAMSLLITDNTAEDSVPAALLMYARADLLGFRNKDSLALLTLDSLLSLYPNHSLADEAYYKKAEIMKKRGNWKEAIAYLQSVVTRYGEGILADDALFEEAGIYEKSLHDQAKAMELYGELMTRYPGSTWVVEARKHYRSLRGDHIN